MAWKRRMVRRYYDELGIYAGYGIFKTDDINRRTGYFAEGVGGRVFIPDLPLAWNGNEAAAWFDEEREFAFFAKNEKSGKPILVWLCQNDYQHLKSEDSDKNRVKQLILRLCLDTKKVLREGLIGGTKKKG